MHLAGRNKKGREGGKRKSPIRGCEEVRPSAFLLAFTYKKLHSEDTIAHSVPSKTQSAHC